jgi:hypothetical protein
MDFKEQFDVTTAKINAFIEDYAPPAVKGPVLIPTSPFATHKNGAARLLYPRRTEGFSQYLTAFSHTNCVFMFFFRSIEGGGGLAPAAQAGKIGTSSSVRLQNSGIFSIKKNMLFRAIMLRDAPRTTSQAHVVCGLLMLPVLLAFYLLGGFTLMVNLTCFLYPAYKSLQVPSRPTTAPHR